EVMIEFANQGALLTRRPLSLSWTFANRSPRSRKRPLTKRSAIHQLTERQINKLEALDRRRVAVHEAGHTVVARELSILEIGATLTRCANSDPTERGWWSGQHRACLEGSEKRVKTMYAVAGLVAETCWRGETILEIDGDDAEILSPTDWATAGIEPRNPG